MKRFQLDRITGISVMLVVLIAAEVALFRWTRWL